MSRDALKTFILASSIICGVSYMASWDLNLPPLVGTLWKGTGVSLLAVWAALSARNRAGWEITAIMGFGALGDVLLEVMGMIPGALAFLVGHRIAIGLYQRYRRRDLTGNQMLLVLTLVPAVVLTAFFLPAARSSAWGVAVYATVLSLMAATALTSRFPLSQVGLGAMMFVVSDLLIFARSGPLHGLTWVGFAVWILYYFGQVLICRGLVLALPNLEAEDQAPAEDAPPNLSIHAAT
ncbi:MAG: lysoplasmalogenase [Phenylobacterium zucineum]|nr:MAG: lysoplasmalogenase [Phenylobacterium zucineum]